MSWVIFCPKHRKIICDECNDGFAALQDELDQIKRMREDDIRLSVLPRMYITKGK